MWRYDRAAPAIAELRRICLFDPRRRPTTLGKRAGVLRHAPGAAQRFAQQHLDLRVDAAELVVGPAHERIVDRRVNPQQDLSALAHLTCTASQC